MRGSMKRNLLTNYGCETPNSVRREEPRACGSLGSPCKSTQNPVSRSAACSGIIWRSRPDSSRCWHFAACANAQRERGELQIEVKDPQGQAAAAGAELVSASNQLKKSFSIAADGKYLAPELAFGIYRLTVTAEGFAAWTALVEIRSEVPVRVTVVLGMAPVNEKVEVTDSATLLDPSETGTIYSLSGESLREHSSAQAARSLSDAINDQPGWLYEANGILHPRGSEYQVQYVLDGVPLTQNRSPAFAPAFDSGDMESMRVLTAGYPAEYGRKLGGVIELMTEKNPPTGWHGRMEVGGGSFDSLNGAGEIDYSSGKNHFELGGQGFHTDRFLDPPVLDNFTNWANGNGLSAAYERDFSDGDRLRFTFTSGESRYTVPNELVQQSAGQRQDSDNTEVSGQIYFQHLTLQDRIWSFSASIRDSQFTAAFERPRHSGDRGAESRLPRRLSRWRRRWPFRPSRLESRNRRTVHSSTRIAGLPDH